MLDCKHTSLTFVGQQKTDEGTNSYYRCNACGETLFATPSGKVYGIPGIQGDDSSGPSTDSGTP